MIFFAWRFSFQVCLSKPTTLFLFFVIFLLSVLCQIRLRRFFYEPGWWATLSRLGFFAGRASRLWSRTSPPIEGMAATARFARPGSFVLFPTWLSVVRL